MKVSNTWPINSNGEIIVQAGTGDSTPVGFLPNDQVPTTDSGGAVVMKLPSGGGSGTVTGVTATAPLASSGGTAPSLSLPAATDSQNGYMTSADHTTLTKLSSGRSVNALGSVSGAVAIDCDGPGVTSFTVGAAITLSLTNAPALNQTVEKTLYITNGGAFGITYMANSRWAGPGVVQTAPTLVTSGTEILKFRAINIGGTVYVDWFYIGRVA